MGAIPDEKLDALEAQWGFTFRDRSLLRQALTHRSCRDEGGGQPTSSNERLEFLGDAALGAMLAFRLYSAHPGWRRGELARVLGAAGGQSTLARAARELRLGDFLLLGKGLERSGGRQRVSILADAVEALVGAAYLQTVATNRYHYAAHPVVRVSLVPLLETVARQQPDVPYDVFLEEVAVNAGTIIPRLLPPGGTPSDRDRISVLENALGCGFRNRGLLKQALTHGSRHVGGEDDPGLSNGRLAFVGAAYVRLTVATHLYFMCPHLSEGQLTRLRTMAASNAALGRLGKAAGLGQILFLSAGEERSGGRERSSVLAAGIQALWAAVCFDAPEVDPERLALRQFVFRLLGPSLSALEQHPDRTDPKTVLQERSEKILGMAPIYHPVSESGADHEKTYVVEVHLGEHVSGTGRGPSKKAAEQAAAGEALENLESDVPSLAQ